MAQICRAQTHEVDTKETKDLFSMATNSPPPPERDISTIAIIVPKTNTSSQPVPSICLTGAADDWPTMDLNTFCDIGGRQIHGSNDVRIVMGQMCTKKKHRRVKRCCKCIQAAWANAYFAEAMKGDKTSVSERDREEVLQKDCIDAQGSKEIESVEEDLSRPQEIQN